MGQMGGGGSNGKGGDGHRADSCTYSTRQLAVWRHAGDLGVCLAEGV